jgi:hypothetical protein
MGDAAPAVVVAEPPPEEPAVIAAGEAAVKIAEIEAERDVKLAEISAEAAGEANAEAVEEFEEDVEWLRTELAGLRTLCETQRDGLSSAMLMLTAIQDQLRETQAALESHMNQSTPPAHSPPIEEAPAAEVPSADGQGEASPASAASPRPEPSSEVSPRARRRAFL